MTTPNSAAPSPAAVDALRALIDSMEHDASDLRLGRQWMACCEHYLPRLRALSRPAPPAVDEETLAVLRRLRDALPTVGINGWAKGVAALDTILALHPHRQEAATPAREGDKADDAHVFACRRCPVSIVACWQSPTCPECGDPTELDPTAKPAPAAAQASDDPLLRHVETLPCRCIKGRAECWRCAAIRNMTAQASDTGRGEAVGFQRGVERWMDACFVPSLYSNMTERGDRLLEEVLELLQSHGYDRTRVATLVDYVYSRPVGEPAQEVGGVMVTLAGYCWIAGLDMHAEGDRELSRITQPEVMAKIRRKQEAKNALHFDTPLPGNAAHTPEDSAGKDGERNCWCHSCRALRPVTLADMGHMVLCPDCGNKRCPHANDHRNACTNSNEPGQPGSAYPAARSATQDREGGAL